MSDKDMANDIEDVVRRNVLKGVGVSALGLAGLSGISASNAQDVSFRGNTGIRVRAENAEVTGENTFIAGPGQEASVEIFGDLTGPAAEAPSSVPLAYQLLFLEVGPDQGTVQAVSQPTFGTDSGPCFVGNIDVIPQGNFSTKSVFTLNELAPEQTGNGPNNISVAAIITDLPRLMGSSPDSVAENLFVLSDSFNVALPGTTAEETPTETPTETPGGGGGTNNSSV